MSATRAACQIITPSSEVHDRGKASR